jgi:rhodanese-related sulfurtransferase
MNTREKYTAGLLCLGLILALLPLTAHRSFIVAPDKLLPGILDKNTYVSVDQVARLVVAEDNSVQIIDLRSAQEFISFNIPGSINVPYDEFIKTNLDGVFNNGKTKYILYSVDDYYSNYALVIAQGLNYKNLYVMSGGLNEWFKTVMNSSFTGEIISARENALFETRTRARKMFTEINSLPDSLKMKFAESKKIAAKKLDGGCE